jgi:hypothetical protein
LDRTFWVPSQLGEVHYRLQAFEIYNEEVFDLLDNRRAPREKIKLALKEGLDRKYFVKDAYEESFSNDDHVRLLLDRCLSNR